MSSPLTKPWWEADLLFGVVLHVARLAGGSPLRPLKQATSWWAGLKTQVCWQRTRTRTHVTNRMPLKSSRLLFWKVCLADPRWRILQTDGGGQCLSVQSHESAPLARTSTRSPVYPTRSGCATFGIWGWERCSGILSSPCSTAAPTRNPGDFWPARKHTQEHCKVVSTGQLSIIMYSTCLIDKKKCLMSEWSLLKSYDCGVFFSRTVL